MRPPQHKQQHRKGAQANKICTAFSQTGRCKWGSYCRFIHDNPAAQGLHHGSRPHDDRRTSNHHDKQPHHPQQQQQQQQQQHGKSHPKPDNRRFQYNRQQAQQQQQEPLQAETAGLASSRSFNQQQEQQQQQQQGIPARGAGGQTPLSPADNQPGPMQQQHPQQLPNAQAPPQRKKFTSLDRARAICAACGIGDAAGLVTPDTMASTAQAIAAGFAFRESPLADDTDPYILL